MDFRASRSASRSVACSTSVANYDFTPEEAARMRAYLLKGGFLWMDDNWDPDFESIRPNLTRILPDARIVALPLEHPVFSSVFRVDPLPQIPSLGSLAA